jgi:electron transfer flavoprotein beta subunit
MKIIVLVKQVPDTYEDRALDTATGLADRRASERIIDEVDERALEVALRVKDADKSTEVVALSMGPAESTAMLRKCLAMGADSAVLVEDTLLSGADAGRTAVVLAAAVRRIGFDLVVAGNESTDGRGGVVPAMVAEHLGVPGVTELSAVQISPGGVRGSRGTETGTLAVRVPLPAAISVTEQAAEARFPSFKGVMSAKRKPLAVWSAGELEVDHVLAALPVARMVDTLERPARSAGTKLDGSVEAVGRLADYLATARLI